MFKTFRPEQSCMDDIFKRIFLNDELCKFQINFHWNVLRFSLISCQHWLSWWLGAYWHQVITLTNVFSILRCHIASLDRNEWGIWKIYVADDKINWHYILQYFVPLFRYSWVIPIPAHVKHSRRSETSANTSAGCCSRSLEYLGKIRVSTSIFRDIMTPLQSSM